MSRCQRSADSEAARGILAVALAAITLFGCSHGNTSGNGAGANAAATPSAAPAPSSATASSSAPASSGANGGFQPTVVNTTPAPGAAPKGMVWIPGGEFSMGANDPPEMNDVGMKATLDSRPIHRVYVDGFYMDKTDVTNAEFAAFVKATAYVTVAERKPSASGESHRWIRRILATRSRCCS